MTKQVKVHGRLGLLDGVVLSSTQNGAFPENPALNTIHSVGTSMYVYTEVSGFQTWFPIAKGSDTATYLHTQAAASLTWQVNHNLNTEDVWFIVKDLDGNYDVPASVEPNPADPTNKLIVTFSEPLTGTMFVVGTRAFSSARLNASVLNVANTVVIDSSGITINGQVLDLESLAGALTSTDLVSQGGTVVDLVDGKIPTALIPNSVEEIIEGATLSAFPVTGKSSAIYITLDTNRTYRWSGSTYVEISPSPGTTDAVPEGSVNLYYTAARARADVDAIPNAQKGTANGVATLDSASKVPLAQMQANIARIDSSQQWSKSQIGQIVNLPYTSNLSLDLSVSNNFAMPLNGGLTLGLPSNIQPGQSGFLILTQDATGGRTITYNAIFKFAGGTPPVLSTAAGSVDYLCYFVETSGRIMISALKDIR